MTEPVVNHRNHQWDEECGRQLELLVGRRGFSAGEFARRVGMTEKSYYKWRHAKSAPLPATKSRIIEVLGGREDPIWQDELFRELALCLGALRPQPPATISANPGTTLPDGAANGPPGIPPTEKVGSDPPIADASDPLPRNRLRRLALVGSLWAVSVLIAAILFRSSRDDGAAPAIAACGTTNPPVEVIANVQVPWRLVCASGAVVPLVATPRNGAFSFKFRGDIAHARVIDPNGGSPVALVVSLDTTQPQNSTGHVRTDCFALTGELLWTHFVDDAPAFADTTLAANAWSLEDVQTLDWNADGRSEILLLCTHTLFPSVLVVLDVEGRRLTEYWNAGHMRRMVPLTAGAYLSLADARPGPFAVPRPAGAGPAIALSVEFQEAPRGAGLVLLAPGFAAGAYPAATADYRHTTLPPARDAVFVRLLPSIVALKHPAGHNWPENIDFDPASRTIRITTIEEPEGDGVLRTLDLTLRQVAVMPTDRFRHKFPDMQRAIGLPEMTSDEMAASVETIAYRTDSAWEQVRYGGTWKP